MAGAEKAMFAALSTLFTADNGGSGLNNSASTAYVRSFTRYEWPTEDSPRPRARAEFVAIDDESPQSLTEFVRCRVRLHVYTARGVDRDLTSMDAILARWRTVLEGVTPATANSYAFTGIKIRRTFKAPATQEENHRIIEFTLGATAGN